MGVADRVYRVRAWLGRPLVLLAAGLVVVVAVLVAVVVGLWVSDESTSSRATALSTVFLALVTVFYAVEATMTRRQMQAQWSEELADRKAARDNDARIARRNQSVEAARRILERFREVHAGELGLARATDERFRVAVDAINADSFEVQDEEVRRRLTVARLVAFTMTFPDSQFESERDSGGKGFAEVLANLALSRTRESLEAHVGRRDLPVWDNLPEPYEAQAWLIDSARQGANSLD